MKMAMQGASPSYKFGERYIDNTLWISLLHKNYSIYFLYSFEADEVLMDFHVLMFRVL
jgi:hypothetical protein